ncbi:MAG: FAD:protein FMN transferase [Bacteroidetes bacterium]|nr:FAD:protein FMN transferase [Bacteroidota bacterium]
MLKVQTINIGIIFMLLFLAGCYPKGTEKVKKTAFQGEAQGTYYTVQYFDNNDRDLKNEIDSILTAFDQSLSAWVPNSILSRVNRNETVLLDKYFIDNFNLSQRIASETNGAFDCTLGPLIEAWGFGFREKITLDQHKIDSIKEFIGYGKVHIENNQLIKSDPRIELSFNAVAQGYSVDLLGQYLESVGIDIYLIDIGGEIIGKGIKPDGDVWKVGIQKPTEDELGEIEAQIKIALTDKALVTSGSYRKYYEVDGVRYSHMIDPSTGYPVTHTMLSATVMADNCAEADAYATAFMIMGIEKATESVTQIDSLEAFFIYTDESGILQTFSTEGLRKFILPIRL